MARIKEKPGPDQVDPLEADREDGGFGLAFHAEVEAATACADRAYQNELPRTATQRRIGEGQDIIMIHAAKGGLRSGLSKGGAKTRDRHVDRLGADHIRVRRQRLEVGWARSPTRPRRPFGFSKVIPQVATTLGFAALAGRWEMPGATVMPFGSCELAAAGRFTLWWRN